MQGSNNASRALGVPHPATLGKIREGEQLMRKT